MPTPSILALHAHPDDEVILTGGVLLQAAEAGYRTAVVTCTDGSLGEIVGEGLDADAIRPYLADYRANEIAEALRILQVQHHTFLGFVDSGMAGDPGNDNPKSFWQAPFDKAVQSCVEAIRAFQPDVVVTYDAFGVYGHPDHIQAHRVGLAAVEAAAFPALFPGTGDPWQVKKFYVATLSKERMAWTNRALASVGLPSPFGTETDAEQISLGTPAVAVTTTVDVTALIKKKTAALFAHATQIGPESLFMNMPDSIMNEFYGVEEFRYVMGSVPPEAGETDLFAGLT